jgi:hypothetical protein
LTWTIAFDGKNLGTVKGQAQSAGSNSKEQSAGYFTFVQRIAAPADAIPSVGSPSEKFAPMGIERWSRLFGQFSPILRWKVCFSV